MKIALFLKSRYCSSELVTIAFLPDFLHVVAENVVTDRQTERHTYEPSTVTFTAHAGRWLISYRETSDNQ